MLTYRGRKRLISFKGGSIPSFPCNAVVRFHFEPKQAFGAEAGGGRTLAANSMPTPKIHFSLSNGRISAENSKPLGDLDIRIEGRDQILEVHGNVVTERAHFESAWELQHAITSNYFALPLVLAARFADPPYVDLVEGEANGHHFVWELQNLEHHFQLATLEQQRKDFLQAWDDLLVIAAPQQRRLLAALTYFHTGCRLVRESRTPSEFLAEALLNFCKVLETLFPGERDDVRNGLRILGVADDAIERDFIPIMILRSMFDVAHPRLTLLTEEQGETLHRYAERAESLLQQLLQDILARCHAGEPVVQPYEQDLLGTAERTTLERLKSRLDEIDSLPAGKGKWGFRIRRQPKT